MMGRYRAVVHCSGTEWGTAIRLDKLHRERGLPSIGYQNVIENGYPTDDHWQRKKRIRLLNGAVCSGLPYSARMDGAEECYGHHANTVAICLIGDQKFTRAQIVMLVKWCQLMRSQFGIGSDDVIGHCELDGETTPCPHLDMDLLRRAVANKWMGLQILDRFDPWINSG